LIKKGFEELGLVDNLKVTTKLGIFILKSVITMRTSRENLFDLIPLKGLEVLFYQRRVEIFIAHPAGRIPTTPLFRAENAKGDPHPLENLHHSNSDLLVSIIKSLKTPREIQPVYFGILSQGFHPEVLGPISPLALVAPPGITPSFQSPKDFLEFIRKSALHENAASPHVDDLVKARDKDWTLLVTVQTGRAGPKGIL
jgi:hypothetical protein